MDVNVRGIVLCAQLVLPGMVAARRGRIINLTSQAGVHRWPLVSAYSVSKAAVVKLTENLALETSRYGISVFSVHPGLLPIGISETVAAHTPTTPHEDHIRRWALNELAAGRGADPDQAVELLLRLAAATPTALSGRHLSVHDDLDAVLARLPEVQTTTSTCSDQNASHRPQPPGNAPADTIDGRARRPTISEVITRGPRHHRGRRPMSDGPAGDTVLATLSWPPRASTRRRRPSCQAATRRLQALGTRLWPADLGLAAHGSHR